MNNEINIIYISCNYKVGTIGVVYYKVGTKLQSRNQWGCVGCVERVSRGVLQWFRLCYITRFTRFTPPSVFLDFSFKFSLLKCTRGIICFKTFK